MTASDNTTKESASQSSIKSRLLSEVDWDTVENSTNYKTKTIQKPHLWSREEVNVLMRALQKEVWTDVLELSEEQIEKLLQRNDIQTQLPKVCQTKKEIQRQHGNIIKYRGMHPSLSMPVKEMYHIPMSEEEKELLQEALEEVPEGTPDRYAIILQKFDFHECRIPTDLKYVVDNLRKRASDKKRKRYQKERKLKREQKAEAQRQRKRRKEEKIDLS